jgi:hypothetical protein
MPKALQRSRLGSAPSRRSPHLGLSALIVLPFAGCFAEPKPETSTPNVSGSSGTGNITTSAGQHAGAGKSQGGAQGTSEQPDTGGAPDAGSGATETGATGGTQNTTGGMTEGQFKCHNATAQPLPARKGVTSKDAPPPAPPPTTLKITRQALFGSFQQSCGINGSCHVGSGDPNAQPHAAFKVTLDTLDQRKTLGDEALERVQSSDPGTWMPPSPYSSGSAKPDNPLYQLAEHLQQWQQKGFPDQFTVPIDSGSSQQPSTNEHPYLLSPDLAAALSNIGSCVPENLTNGAIMEDPLVDEMQKKDELFAGMKTSDDLPDTILETDLVTLDSTELAQRRVFSYAPTYPLYSDHAGKMRYVRVPLGETIHYDDKLHDFTIPDNTRFYKTFLKPVIDKDGNTGWRKMETRLIVVRQDSQNSDGSYTTQGLRASYAWDKDETMAHRVKDPFRDGTAARDRMCPYVVDERVTRDPLKNPISDAIGDTCEYMTQDEMVDPKSGQIRHYAIPSTQRCDQCHMGSSSHSFVLGFTPWQVDRRKKGEGGIYEDPNDDELTQLQRFLDYGIVDGIKPGQVKLEESQLIAAPPRSPRNDYELTAQGYMMGNCAFCHNPHGFPVATNPILKEFELFPSETGGIFQFPLDKYSPRAKAGQDQTTLVPYIAPAFGDFVLTDDTDYIHGNGKSEPMGSLPVFMPDPSKPEKVIFALNDAQSFNTPDYNRQSGHFRFLAPWRSLIWRNVYTPFTYTDHSTLYIHMPRNAAGFDCRAAHIMAKWMLSIPVHPAQHAATDVDPYDPVDGQSPEQPLEFTPDDSTQAFGYGQAILASKQRVEQYENSVVGEWCPEDDDIVDPSVVLSLDPTTGMQSQTTPVDSGFPPGPRVNSDFESSSIARQYGDGVPSHAHWIPTDTTEKPGKWIPRRQNWKNFLVTRDVTISADPTNPSAVADMSAVIDDLQNVHLSPQLEQFATQPLPMGTWDPNCQSTPEAQATPTVTDVVADLSKHPGAPLTRWLLGEVFHSEGAPSKLDHVHFQSRGEGVFRGICQNCHGRQIDSKSALAATIQELTGGSTRVANFIAGLFGPPSAPGAFAHDEFLIGDGLPSEDWQARYVLFMGLGGTGAKIPQSVLNLVATSPFYGNPVKVPGATSPNMLGSAQQLCFFVLNDPRHLGIHGPEFRAEDTKFVPGVGHYELWESLCATGNEPVVRVFNPGTQGTEPVSSSVYRAKDEAGTWIYPPDLLVGTHWGTTETGIQTTNLMPWCVRVATTEDRDRLDAWATTVGLSKDQLPVCPESLFATIGNFPVYQLALDQSGRKGNPSVPFSNADFTDHWLRHGAFNAGLSAFYFMRGFAEHTITPDKAFDFCRQ